MAKKQDENKTIDEAPYELVMQRLMETVESLEGGDLTLEQQIKMFEEGIRLVRRGQTLLDEAERKVEILLDGDETAPFDGGEAEDSDED